MPVSKQSFYILVSKSTLLFKNSLYGFTTPPPFLLVTQKYDRLKNIHAIIS
jgi:hypothetical protein